jgi:hypothetical protein
MTDVQKIWIGLADPVMMLLLLFVIVSCGSSSSTTRIFRVCKWTVSRCRCRRRSSNITASVTRLKEDFASERPRRRLPRPKLASQKSSHTICSPAVIRTLDHKPRSSDIEAQLCEPLLAPRADDDARGDADCGASVSSQDGELVAAAVDASVSSRDALVGAVACLALFCYTSVAEHTMKLLNCVEVNGRHVLLYAGAQVCDIIHARTCRGVVFTPFMLHSWPQECDFGSAWQSAGVLLVAFVCFVPLLPITIRHLTRARHNQRWQRCIPRCPPSAMLDHIVDGIRVAPWLSSLTSPYVEAHWHWAAVAMLQRISIVMCGAFVPHSMTALCFESYPPLPPSSSSPPLLRHLRHLQR